jgi:hypothetical protein
MLNRVSVLLVVLASVIGLAACQPGQPTVPQEVPIDAPTATESVDGTTAVNSETSTTQAELTLGESNTDGFQEILSYVSPEWIEREQGDVLGAAIQLVDVAQIRRDLAIPPITGASPPREKTDLILALSNQGFSISLIDSKNPSSFAKWGWDVANIEQSLVFADDFTSIMLGNFDQSTISDRLEEKGYQASSYGDFTLYLKDVKPMKQEPLFAWKDRTLIISSDEGTLKNLIDRKASGKPGLDRSAALQKILPYLAGAWGAFLAPRGSLEGYPLWLRLQLAVDSDQASAKPWLAARSNQAGQIAWDMLAISWRGKPPITLRFLYLYPTAADAQKDVELVKESLTTAPSFRLNQAWGKSLTLETAAARDTLVVATATTNNEALVSAAWLNREWALFPIRSVATSANASSSPNAAVTTSTESVPLDSGWVRYTKAVEGFSLALPSEWLQFDVNPTAVDSVLKKMADDEPALKSMLTDQLRSAAATGLKFFGFEMPHDLTSREFALVNVMQSSVPSELPLETLGTNLRGQYNEMSTVVKPVKLERIRLPAGEARRFTFTQNRLDGTGKTQEIVLTQYLLLNGSGYPVLLSFGAPASQAEIDAPIFEEIAQSFQFVK